MPLKDPQKIYGEWDKKLFSKVYFLFGEESFFVDEALTRIKKSAISGEAFDFNFSCFDAREHKVSQVVDEAMTLPVFSNLRVVFFRDVHELSEKEWTLLNSYILKPSDSSIMVLTAVKIDKRKKFFKSLFEQIDVVEFRKPFEYQIPQWIKYLAQSQGLKISDEARQLLHRLVGSHLVELQREMEKLKNFLGDRTQIEVEDVRRVVSSSREESVFEFTKAVGQIDRVQALESLAKLLDQGQNEIGVVSLLARHVRILLQVKRGQDLGLYGGKLAEKTQLPNYFIEEYSEQAKRWSTKRLHFVLEALSDTDRALKSSPVSSHIWLENLVLRTCGDTSNFLD